MKDVQLVLTQEWDRMIKYSEEHPQNKNLTVSAITPIASPRDQLGFTMMKSPSVELDEFNETIPRMHMPDNNILNQGSSKEICEFHREKIKQYKQEIEALNIENHSLKKAIQHIRALSPQTNNGITQKQTYRRTLTSIKTVGTIH